MKKIYVFLILTILFMPFMVNASILNEVPPYIDIEDINLDNYEVTKSITSDKVIIGLTDKFTKEYYSWSFDKDKIGERIKLNFEIDFVSTKKEEIDSIVGNIDKTYISFAHHGDLPSNADIKIYVGNQYKDGKKLNLYYYNENKKQIEYIDGNLKVKDGFIEFEINHCSEYFLTGTIINDAANNPKNVNYVIIGLFFVVMGLLTYTMFKKR